MRNLSPEEQGEQKSCSKDEQGLDEEQKEQKYSNWQ